MHDEPWQQPYTFLNTFPWGAVTISSGSIGVHRHQMGDQRVTIRSSLLDFFNGRAENITVRWCGARCGERGVGGGMQRAEVLNFVSLPDSGFELLGREHGPTAGVTFTLFSLYPV